MTTITIPKKKIYKEGGVVVLSLKEYRKLSEQAVPTFYLRGKAAQKLDMLVKRGLEDYRAGRTKIIKSLADLGKLFYYDDSDQNYRPFRRKL